MAKTYKEMLDERIRGVQQPAEVTTEAPKGTLQAVMGTETPEVTTDATTKTNTNTNTGTAGTAVTQGTVAPATPTTPVVQMTTPVAAATPVVGQVKPQEAAPTTAAKAPSWNDLVADLGEADEEAEKRKQEILKKQRTAKAIAALGDFATHALNVWGASKSGVSAPIKGAPISDAVNAKHKEILDEHAAKLKEYKVSRTEKQKRLYNEWKDRQELAMKQDKGDIDSAYKYARLEYLYADSERKRIKTEVDMEKKRIETNIKELELQLKKEMAPAKKKELETKIAKMQKDMANADKRLELAEKKYELAKEKAGYQKEYNETRIDNTERNRSLEFKVGDEVHRIHKSAWKALWPQLYGEILKREKQKHREHTYDSQKENYVKQVISQHPDLMQRIVEVSDETVEDAEDVAQAETPNQWEQYKVNMA